MPKEETIYQASSYYRPLKQYFNRLNLDFIPEKLEFKADLTRAFNLDRWLYYPISASIIAASRWFARSHVGIPQVYLLWIVVGVVITITMIFWLA